MNRRFPKMTRPSCRLVCSSGVFVVATTGYAAPGAEEASGSSGGPLMLLVALGGR